MRVELNLSVFRVFRIIWRFRVHFCADGMRAHRHTAPVTALESLEEPCQRLELTTVDISLRLLQLSADINCLRSSHSL